MFGRIRQVRKLWVSGLFPGINVFDEDTKFIRDNRTGKLIVDEVKNLKLTGWDRLYYMYSVDEFGALSPELITTLQGTFMAFFVGGVIGGFVRSRTAFLSFVDTNDATKFETHLQAKAELQTKVAGAFVKGALQWAWRLSLFTSTYLTISSSISAYRGDCGILEHSAAGLVTGGMYKANLGLRGMVVGGTLGMVLGSFAGFLTWGMLKLAGVSMEDVRSYHYSIKTRRDGAFNKAFEISQGNVEVNQLYESLQVSKAKEEQEPKEITEKTLV